MRLDCAGAGPEGIEPVRADAYDGVTAAWLAEQLHLPRVLVFARVGSTLDVAHAAAAEGAPSGLLVLADEQTAGRGRMGRVWESARGRGIWLTIVERPASIEAISVLSIRIGLAAASVLDPFADSSVQLKWPNDLYVRDRKLAGILIEARWHAERLDWIVVGFGLNVRQPVHSLAAGLGSTVSRIHVLESLVPALRAAAAVAGPLTTAERSAFADRDLAHGRRCVTPTPGVVRGIDAFGALLVDSPEGQRAIHSGSLALEPLPGGNDA